MRQVPAWDARLKIRLVTMTLANFLFVLVLISGLETLVVLFVGVLSMGRDQAEETVGAGRSNRLTAWR